MTDRKRVLHDLEIQNTRVTDLLYDDFNAYQSAFERIDGDSPQQDLRAAFLSWMLTFARELFPPDLVKEIADFVIDAQDRDDYTHYGWHNTLHLRAGLFAVSNDYEWLDDAIDNLAHQSSSLRGHVARTLAPVIHLVDSAHLVDGIAENLSLWHFSNIYPLTLYVAAKGESNEKLEQLTEWAREYPKHNDSKRLAALSSGEPIENVFSPQFRRVERYMLLRLCSEPVSVPIQRVACWGENATRSGLRQEPHVNVDADVILARIEGHPLSGEFVDTPKAQTKSVHS
jgi:hypothetical protein